MINLYAKQNLTTKELHLLSSEMELRKKSSGTAWILWFFTGGIGGHRYYLGKYKTAIAMTLTLGCFGFWTFIDLFLNSGMIKKRNDEIESEIITNLQLLSTAKEND